MANLPRRFFVSGTDTDIGKTFVSALCVAGLSAMYWKPVQTGFPPDRDRDTVQRLTGLGDDHFFPERFCFKEPISPHRAAEKEKSLIRLEDFVLPDSGDRHLVVEGAGGLLVPLADHLYMTDLIRHLDLPVLLVCRTGLGTLNHTFLSVEALKNRGIPIVGIVANGPLHRDNLEDLTRMTGVPLLAHVPFCDDMQKQDLKALFDSCFDPEADR
ncbi:dethiobiotin synthetase [Desulfobotulus alkaliphilus]|uniref:ATP-dependent dethiobiotin synthetase BioD n=1 Tax=Desulfobotulus alkaliphilus TaxID=622671 RepID=A0A562RQ33_9BACT|nr:dethiobiotin synthase [Desulfobotulus alkaliphilus]TWI71231.1 dethiobiotin synthetase [Desulfobotulus alkaliphilus]